MTEEGDLFPSELRSYVFRDPSEKQEEVWRVLWKGQVCRPTFNSKGAAEACLDLYKSGHRKPELPTWCPRTTDGRHAFDGLRTPDTCAACGANRPA